MSAIDVPSEIVPIVVETAADAEAVEALILAAFGPGRFAKTAERLRESAELVQGFVARDHGRVIGSVRLWRVAVGGTEALFLGPIVVDRPSRRGGLGAELVQACLSHAQSLGRAVLLVGDPPYFSRFGFRVTPDVTLPGPVDPGRVMVWGAAELSGLAAGVRKG